MEGEWTEEPARIKRAISEHFQHQFQRKVFNRIEFPLELIEAKLDDVDGQLLTNAFSEEEIRSRYGIVMAQKARARMNLIFSFLRVAGL